MALTLGFAGLPDALDSVRQRNLDVSARRSRHSSRPRHWRDFVSTESRLAGLERFNLGDPLDLSKVPIIIGFSP